MYIMSSFKTVCIN